MCGTVILSEWGTIHSKHQNVPGLSTLVQTATAKQFGLVSVF